jgi:hypothetical protein
MRPNKLAKENRTSEPPPFRDQCPAARIRNQMKVCSTHIDQGSPCPLATLNPFGRELLHSNVLAGIKQSTWINILSHGQ